MDGDTSQKTIRAVEVGLDTPFSVVENRGENPPLQPLAPENPEVATTSGGNTQDGQR